MSPRPRCTTTSAPRTSSSQAWRPPSSTGSGSFSMPPSERRTATWPRRLVEGYIDLLFDQRPLVAWLRDDLAVQPPGDRAGAQQRGRTPENAPRRRRHELRGTGPGHRRTRSAECRSRVVPRRRVRRAPWSTPAGSVGGARQVAGIRVALEARARPRRLRRFACSSYLTTGKYERQAPAWRRGQRQTRLVETRTGGDAGMPEPDRARLGSGHIRLDTDVVQFLPQPRAGMARDRHGQPCVRRRGQRWS